MSQPEPTFDPQPAPLAAHKSRPSMLGGWYLLFGALLGPAIILTNRAQGMGWAWILLSGVMVGLIAHRLSITYYFDPQGIVVHSWWGLGRPESIALKDLTRVDVHYSFSLRVVGQGHIFLASDHPDDPGIILLAQKKPEAMAARLLALAEAARALASSTSS